MVDIIVYAIVVQVAFLVLVLRFDRLVRLASKPESQANRPSINGNRSGGRMV